MTFKTVWSLSGNSGGPVAANQTSGNLSVVGSGGVLVTGNAGTNTLTITSAAPAATSFTGNTGGPISPIAGNLNIVGSGTVSVAGAGNTLTISVPTPPPSFIWVNNATTTTMLTNHGYIVTSGSQTLTLPSSASIGDLIEILLNGGTAWTLAQAAGQQIRSGNKQTTAGVAGSCQSTQSGDTIRIADAWFDCDD